MDVILWEIEAHNGNLGWVFRCHIFYSRRAVDVIDGLPKFAKHKDESELIPERVDEDTEKQEAHHKS